MKEEQFICVQGWMRTVYDLKGNELLTYALIYGFTQDGESEFTGSINYIASWIGATGQTVHNTLKSLLEKGLLRKQVRERNRVRFCAYTAVLPAPKNFDGGTQNILSEAPKNFDGGTQNILSKNKDENTIETTGENIKPEKHRHGEYRHVLLTDGEMDKLLQDYGFARTEAAITYLDRYIEEKGYKAKSHYLSLRRWVFDAIKKAESRRNLEWIDGVQLYG